ncbi:helix-turn-helix domain-containing protein [Aeromonas dhakensis]|uniref:helix-turn-helix domain-containing protein n=1 Tax=Aeromonas dhakensis TaxID=196024 RepID=UPI002B474F0B|nr:helix-turn-helix domain-containing protein [Aeromonas dhakensis]
MQLKEKRDAAILEKHKEGKSNRAIAAALSLPARTVDDVVKGLRENGLAPNPRTPEDARS